MPLKLFKTFVSQVKEMTDIDFGITDEYGTVLACSDRKREGTSAEDVVNAIDESKNDIFIHNNETYCKIYIKNRLSYMAFISSDKSDYNALLGLAAINIRNLKIHYEEKYDRTNLIKNIIMDNILPGDISLRVKELHMEYNVKRVVYLIKLFGNTEFYPPDIIQGLYPDKNRDFVIVIDESSTVLVRQLKPGETQEDIMASAKIIADTLTSELMVRVFISTGNIADNMRDVGRSYKEAQTAMLIGGIFESERQIVSYSNLGLGRLIYQLPTTLCKLFLSEVLSENAYEALDSETMMTIDKFFENSLNVSETARQLYIHRNTLVYRLDKIKKITDLDLREFDDAILFKVSMLVKRYLDKNKLV